MGTAEPRVALERVPDGQRDAPAAAQHAPRLAQRGRRVDHQHVAPAAQHGVDARDSRSIDSPSSTRKLDVGQAELRAAGPRDLDHRLGLVAADQLAAGLDQRRRQEADLARPGGELEHALPGPSASASIIQRATRRAQVRWRPQPARASSLARALVVRSSSATLVAARGIGSAGRPVGVMVRAADAPCEACSSCGSRRGRPSRASRDARPSTGSSETCRRAVRRAVVDVVVAARLRGRHRRTCSNAILVSYEVVVGAGEDDRGRVNLRFRAVADDTPRVAGGERRDRDSATSRTATSATLVRATHAATL